MLAFLEDIRRDAFDLANDVEHGGLRLPSLSRVIMDRLEEAGTMSDGHVAYYQRQYGNATAEVHAYSYDAEEDLLSLFLCIDPAEADPMDAPARIVSMQKEEVERGFRRLETFVKFAKAGKMADVEESQPVSELLSLMAEKGADGRALELNILGTGTVSDKAAVFVSKDGMNREVWDILRLSRACGGIGEESVSVDFEKDYGAALPCLIAASADAEMQVLLTCVPAQTLADIYQRYRSRLLERNVRSFLQFTGKVNKGIRDTLINAPGRFLPYNNGLSATASGVDYEDLGNGLARVRAVRDFQIVNGGQTTASIAACARKDGVDLTHVAVPLKLTVVPREQLDELVPLISRFANTQNRIQEADFSANHPWHIELERQSRSIWTRPVPGSPHGTRWFYERSRGQYADALAAKGSPAGRKQFRTENPSRQKFTKTDIAKYVLSWDQRPAAVSKGAQKCFLALMSQISREGRKLPDEAEFRRLVALAVLFQTCERLYTELGYQGYRANVVTFSIAYLSQSTQRRLPWDDIWEKQSLPGELLTALKLILVGVRQAILSPPPNRNITEWCKRDECWSAVQELEVQLVFKDATKWGGAAHQDDVSSQYSQPEQNLIELVWGVPAAVWFDVATWAKDTNSLMPWQRSLAFSLGTLSGRQKKPSVKQATQGAKLLIAARGLAYGHAELSDDLVGRLAEALKTVQER